MNTLLFHFFLKKNTKYFSTHIGREEKVLKKLIIMYIQNGITLGYTA